MRGCAGKTHGGHSAVPPSLPPLPQQWRVAPQLVAPQLPGKMASPSTWRSKAIMSCRTSSGSAAVNHNSPGLWPEAINDIIPPPSHPHHHGAAHLQFLPSTDRFTLLLSPMTHSSPTIQAGPTCSSSLGGGSSSSGEGQQDQEQQGRWQQQQQQQHSSRSPLRSPRASVIIM
jgi:hypothetical protein